MKKNIAECKNISMRNDQFYIIYEIDDEDSVYGFNQWYLQQDNARPHIKKYILDAMASLRIQILPGWPPYSPDLNIIETIWAIMKRRIDQQRPQSIDELKQTILNVRENVSYNTINALVAEMPRRLIQVIAMNGMTIQHL